MPARSEKTVESRRTFLHRQFKWLAGITTAGLLLPLLRFTGFTVKPKPRYIRIDRVLAPGMVHGDPEFFLFAGTQGLLAVSRRCTHLGCRVNYRQELGIIECPCHQSRFALDGVRLAGPAERNLPTYPVRVLQKEDGSIAGYEVTL